MPRCRARLSAHFLSAIGELLGARQKFPFGVRAPRRWGRATICGDRGGPRGLPGFTFFFSFFLFFFVSLGTCSERDPWVWEGNMEWKLRGSPG